MSNIIYERHMMSNPALPFIFHTDSVHTTQIGSANWHDNPEFLYCIEGSGVVNCDDAQIRMNVGDTIIINARHLHSITSEDKVKYHCFIIDNSFFIDNGIDINKLVFNEKISDSHSRLLIQRITECINENDTQFGVAEIRLAVLEFICYIAKNYSENKQTSGTKVSKSYTAVLDTIEYINNHFGEKLSLDALSAKAGFSRYHFSRIFKENTGLTVVEHINARRCDSASFLLRETTMPISEIGLECGFESPSYFAKSFSEAYGILPSDYRKKYSKK